jgi:hypothetical protein
MANSPPTRQLLGSHRTIHHRSLRPLGRKNLAPRMRCPIGPHLRKSPEPLTSFAAHWGGRANDEKSRNSQTRSATFRFVMCWSITALRPSRKARRSARRPSGITSLLRAAGGSTTKPMSAGAERLTWSCISPGWSSPLRAGRWPMNSARLRQLSPTFRSLEVCEASPRPRRNPSRNWRQSTRCGTTHRPNPSLVFLHRDPRGKVRGATLRDTRQKSAFRPCLGNKLLTAWFAVGNFANADRIVAVESPIDALSYYSLFTNHTKRWRS